MRRPSFQFYPADWLGSTNLRRCTGEEKGAWIDVMCLLHDADDYGVLRWPLGDIARAVGCHVETLAALVRKGVMKGADEGHCAAFIYTPRSGRRDGDPVALIESQPGPIWYSSRMVRDEYVRQNRGQSSRFDEDEQPRGNTPKDAPQKTPKSAPKPPFGDGSSSSSSSSSIPTTSGASAPPASGEPDPIFGHCLAFLTGKGCAAKSSRSFLGLMRKNHGDAAVVQAIERAERDDIADPIPWLRKYLEAQPKASPGTKTAPAWTESLL